MSILIKGIKMPKSCWDCELGSAQQLDDRPCPFYSMDYREQKKYSDKRVDGCPLVELPPHGRLIDADALIADLKRQCKEVFRIDTVSPDDFWITRNEAYNERLWTTWCESLYDYINAAPTIIEAEEGEDVNTD